jgi:hypothetical protein
MPLIKIKPKIKRKLPKKRPIKSTTTLVRRIPNKSSTTSRTTGKATIRNAVEALCAITDPFCNHAQGVRWPDGNGNNSIPITSRVHLTMTTFTNGGALTYFNPYGFPYGVLTAATYAAGSYTLNTIYTSASGPINFSTTFSTYRVVSAGIIIRNLMTVMNTSGYIIISRPNYAGTLGGVEPVGYDTLYKTMIVPITPGMEFQQIFLPVGIEARSFIPLNNSSNTQLADPSWDNLRVEIVGAQVSTVALDIEFVVRLEVTPTFLSSANNSILFQQTNPVTTHSSTILVNAANEVRNAITNDSINGLKAFSSTVVRYATKALTTYLFPESNLLRLTNILD